MQWLGSDIPGPGGYTAEAYASEGNQEVHPAPAGAPHSQQRVSVALNLTEREPTIKNFPNHRRAYNCRHHNEG